jgi:hypothetical protein
MLFILSMMYFNNLHHVGSIDRKAGFGSREEKWHTHDIQNLLKSFIHEVVEPFIHEVVEPFNYNYMIVSYEKHMKTLKYRP